MAAATLAGVWFTDVDAIDITIPKVDPGTPNQAGAIDFTGYTAGILFVDERMGSGNPVAPQNGISGGFSSWAAITGSPFAVGSVSGFVAYLGTGTYLGTNIVLDYSATNRLAVTAIGYGLTAVDTANIRVGTYASGTGTTATATSPSSPVATSILLAHTVSNIGTVAGTTTEASWAGQKVASAVPVLNATCGTRAASAGDTTYVANGWASAAWGAVMLELPNTSATTVQASANLAGGDGALVATGTRIVQASANLAGGDGALTATGVRTVNAAAALAGGDGALTAAGVRTVVAAASLPGGDGSLSAAGVRTVMATAALEGGDGALAAAGVRTVHASALLEGGDGSLVATGTSGPAAAGAPPLVGRLRVRLVRVP